MHLVQCQQNVVLFASFVNKTVFCLQWCGCSAGTSTGAVQVQVQVQYRCNCRTSTGATMVQLWYEYRCNCGATQDVEMVHHIITKYQCYFERCNCVSVLSTSRLVEQLNLFRTQQTSSTQQVES